MMVDALEPRRVLSSVYTQPDTYTSYHDTTLSVDVYTGVLQNPLTYDSGYDDDWNTTLTASVVMNPSNGAVVLRPDGSFDYTPSDDFVGTDTFTYTACIGGICSAPTTVTIEVENHRPGVDILYTNTFEVSHDTWFDSGAPVVCRWDADDEEHTLEVVVVSNVTHGTLDFRQDGSFEYIPNLRYVGPDSFSIAYRDRLGEVSDPIDFTISVTNVAPNVGDDGNFDSYGGDVVRIDLSDLLVNDSDPDDFLSVPSFNLGAPGPLDIRRVGGELIVIPPMPKIGDPPKLYTFTYSLTDSVGATGTGTVKIFVYGNTLKEMWLATINREEAKHIGYRYYEELGLASVYSALRGAASQVGYELGSTPGADAKYSPYYNKVTVPTGTTTLDPTAVLHESIHVLDDFNCWYLSDTGASWNLNYAERLAHGGANSFLISNSAALDSLRQFEDRVFDGSSHDLAYILDKWNWVLQCWSELPACTYTYDRPYPLSAGDIPIGIAGWTDIRAKLGFNGLSSVAARYTQDVLPQIGPTSLLNLGVSVGTPTVYACPTCLW